MNKLDRAVVQLSASLDQRVERSKRRWSRLDRHTRDLFCHALLTWERTASLATFKNDLAVIGLLTVITSAHNEREQ